MGNGLVPGPINDFGTSLVVDEGTTTRTESPPPGPIGLDSKGGSPKQTQVSMADQIVNYPRQRQGQRVGDGECYTLTDRSLRNAGARSAADYGEVVPDADYVWGTEIALTAVQPGDLIQFRNYRYEREVETNHPDGSGSTHTDVQERPHHTAIVERVQGNGAITVLEQNAPPGSAIVRTQLFFSNADQSSGDTRTRITVQGTVWFYRPQAAH